MAFAVLTSARDARDFADSVSGSERDFALTGTVISVFSPDIAIEDRTGIARIRCEDVAFPARGDLVAVHGRSETDYSRWKTLHATSIGTLGHTATPDPIEVSIREGIDDSLNYRTIRTTGVVTSVFPDEIDANYARLMVRDGERAIDVSMKIRGPIADYLDKRIRLTGTYRHHISGRRLFSGNTICVEGPDDIRIIGDAPLEDASVPPLGFIHHLSPAEVARMDRRHVDGTVIAAWGTDRFLLRTDDRRTATVTLSGIASLPRVGCRVRAIGSPDTDLFNINLVNAGYRLLSGDTRDEAEAGEEIALKRLLSDDLGRPRFNTIYHGRTVSLTGEINDTMPVNGRVNLRSGAYSVPIDFSTNPEALRRLEPGMTVKATGVIVLEADSWRPNVIVPRVKGLALVTRCPGDIRILANPPRWTVSRMMWVVGGLILLMIVVLVLNRVLNRIATSRKVAERTRLAVELHDSLSQGLSGVACQISAARRGLPDGNPTAIKRLDSARRMLSTCQTELRNCLFDLRSNTIDDPDFHHAVCSTLLQFDTDAEILVHVRVRRSLLPDPVAHAVLEIVRELVGNALRHGHASSVHVGGSVEHGRLLLFSVQDNGCGFDPADCPGPVNGHFGLAGIRNRLNLLNGTLSLTRNQPRGMYARITIPIPK